MIFRSLCLFMAVLLAGCAMDARQPVTNPATPSALAARRLKAADELEVIAVPSVFAGHDLPTVQVTKPADFAQLFGKYTVRTTYYDAAYHVVTRADLPGRYGAIIEITTESGRRFERFLTLFRQPQWIDWEGTAIVADVTFPSEFGFSPNAARRQGRIMSEFFKAQLQQATGRGHDVAVMLVGLYEAKAGDGPLPMREGFMARDQQWWFGLRKKVGAVHHRYQIQLPHGYDERTADRWPLIIFLHGSGECGENLDLVARNPLAERAAADPQFPFILVMPQCPMNEWWSPWLVNDLLDEVQAKYRVDLDRVYLTGLSLGGYGTWDTVIAFPDRFAAIVPICGAGDETDVARIKNVPAWVFHGGKDPTVPIAYANAMVDALRKIGGRVRLTIFPEAHHNSWTQAYATVELYSWLLQQRRGAPAEPRALSAP